MLDIGAVRWEFVVKNVDALMDGADVQAVSIEVYNFARREDIKKSTLAIACQMVRELRVREREGEELSRQAIAFIERYDRCRKEGRSIDLTPMKKPLLKPGKLSHLVPTFPGRALRT